MNDHDRDLSTLEEKFARTFVRNLLSSWGVGLWVWLFALFCPSLVRAVRTSPTGFGSIIDAWQWTTGPDDQTSWTIVLGIAAFVGTLNVAVVAASWRPSQLSDSGEMIVTRWANAMEGAQMMGSWIAVAAAANGAARTPASAPLFFLAALVTTAVAAATRFREGAFELRLAHHRAQQWRSSCDRSLDALREAAPAGALGLTQARRRRSWVVLFASPVLASAVSVIVFYVILYTIFKLRSVEIPFSVDLLPVAGQWLLVSLLSLAWIVPFYICLWITLHSRYVAEDSIGTLGGFLGCLFFGSLCGLWFAALGYQETWQQKLGWGIAAAGPVLSAGVVLFGGPGEVIWGTLHVALERKADLAAQQVEATGRSVRRLAEARPRPISHLRRPPRRSRLLSTSRRRGD